jgi:starch-binding outer membrane protein, SusD/RagB family
VYTVIINDLKAAIPALPASYTSPDQGRATSGAAQALLGKVYLTEQQYDSAAMVLGAVINSGTYQLTPRFMDPFTISLQFTNLETIFQVNYGTPATIPGVVGSIMTLFALPEGFPGGDAYGLIQVDPQLVGEYSATDTRADSATIMLSPYTDALGRTTTWSVPSLNSHGGAGAAFHKYLDETNAQNMTARAWEDQENGWVVLRYADVLLMYAEAVNDGGTPTSMSAQAAYNLVAQRGDPSAPPITVTGTAFQDSIIVQRDKEFAFEGQRWFDLSRWGILDSVITAKTGRIAAAYPGETTQHGVVSNLFPIPLTEIQVNPKLTQNPGY